MQNYINDRLKSLDRCTLIVFSLAFIELFLIKQNPLARIMQKHSSEFSGLFRKNDSLRTIRIQIQDTKVSLCQCDLIPNLNIRQFTRGDQRVPTFIISAGLFCFISKFLKLFLCSSSIKVFFPTPCSWDSFNY